MRGETSWPRAVVVAPADDFVDECIVRGLEAWFAVFEDVDVL